MAAIERLKGRDEFAEVSRRGRRFPGSGLAITYLPADSAGTGDGEGSARVAYAVGRGIGTAVARNRVRRRLRSIMRELADDQRVPAGSYLVSVYPGASDHSYADLKASVYQTLPKSPTEPAATARSAERR